MNDDFSKEAFVKFLDYLIDKGLIKFQTVRGWRSATAKIMADLSEAEEADVRKVNLELAVHRVANRDSGLISPDSLHTYRKRVSLAIEEFVRWKNDPAGYKPRGLNGQFRNQTNGERNVRPSPVKKAINSSQIEKSEKEVVHISSGLTLSFPLREDFLAQVVIPRDLKTSEAKRLGAFFLTIAVDYQPE
jgi:hypothetical protein